PGKAGSGMSGIYFDVIQDSSDGLARNLFSRSMSSGLIFPSSAATSQTASKLEREWLTTFAAASRSRP
ncbi:helix-turn-helix transcriptional regulator, partial [Dysosmobacter welbionis]